MKLAGYLIPSIIRKDMRQKRQKQSWTMALIQ